MKHRWQTTLDDPQIERVSICVHCNLVRKTVKKHGEWQSTYTQGYSAARHAERCSLYPLVPHVWKDKQEPWETCEVCGTQRLMAITKGLRGSKTTMWMRSKSNKPWTPQYIKCKE